MVSFLGKELTLVILYSFNFSHWKYDKTECFHVKFEILYKINLRTPFLLVCCSSFCSAEDKTSMSHTETFVKRKCLIFGYIRNMEKSLSLPYDIPIGITQIILAYYPLNFVFNRDVKGVNLSEDGLTLKCKSICHRIRFGEFLHNTDGVIFEVTFDLVKATLTRDAFGFITPEFYEALEPTTGYNYGENHSCSITGAGYFVTTTEDFTSMTEYHERTIDTLRYLWNCGDKLHIEIDMISQKGRMWNDDDKEKKKLFEINLPETAAIFIDVAYSDFEITAVHQQFIYQ